MLHILNPGDPEKWTNPSDQDIQELNTLRDQADESKTDIGLSSEWVTKKFGAWLGA